VFVYEDPHGKILDEPYVEYSRQCAWDERLEMTALPQMEAYNDINDSDLFRDSDYVPENANNHEDLELDVPDLLEPESTSESEDFHTAVEHSDTSDSESDSDFEPGPQTLLAEEKKQSTEIIHHTYEGWWNSKLKDLSPETVMYAFLALTDGIAIPTTYEEAMNGPESKYWKAAMDAETAKLKNANTFSLKHLSAEECVNVVKCRWVFKKKLDLYGNVKEYKARLVAKGFTQKYGIDFYETFAPVVKLKSLRLLVQITASHNFQLYQDDAPSAFLNGELKEKIITEQIPGYNDGSGRLCVLNKTLYGLKQSPREWNEIVDIFLKEEGFTPTVSDPCVYIKHTVTN
jgi:hypothetical protein